MYCLQGTTRRGRYVRAGIVAADPRFFPLARYIELYIGVRYLGRFLVDDTGKRIRGSRIDVWTASCREARRFGLQTGTAVLVHRGTPTPSAVQLAGSARATRPK
jgi:3D (Asp-Asp-Asp) domain-containing protein